MSDLASGIYPSGFRVGMRVRLKPGPRKYNSHIFMELYQKGVVVDPPNIDGWPDDAVQVSMDGGQGALDASVLEKIDP